MELQIPFNGGDLNIKIALPESNISVLKSKNPTPLRSLDEIVKDALSNPIGNERLSDIVHAGDSVAVLFDDWTRPTPVSRIAPIVIEELKIGGVRDEDIVFVCGNGLHDPEYMTDDLLIGKLGKDIFNGYKVISHDAYDTGKLTFIGVSKGLGTPLFINKTVAEADIKVSIGRIVPHDDVGYSGGGKMIMPGVSDVWSIIHNHSGSHPHQGILNNPLREDIDECGRMAGLDFILNVVHNSREEVLKAFAGDPVEAFLKGVEFGDREVWGAGIEDDADIVIASPGINEDHYFLSAMGCLGVANRCLKKDGTIIVVASCSRGWDEDRYVESSWGPPEDLLEYDYSDLLRLVMSSAWHEPKRQFQALIYYVQHLAKTCFEKNVVLAGAKGFNKKYTERINIKFDESVNNAVNDAIRKYGERAKVIVLTDAFTLPLKQFHQM